jgi:tetratricopeptide (TPR) repeat protein
MATKKAAGDQEKNDKSQQEAAARLAGTGRNDVCPCGSGKKYKKCHLQADEAAASPPPGPPDPLEHVQAGWRMFEQRRPGAAEKEFRAALAIQPGLAEAEVGVGLARLSAGDQEGAREALKTVVTNGEPLLSKLRKEGVTDAFSRKEAQPVVRACHALGCLAVDQEKYEEALVDLERVYAVDNGPVGTEARLVAGKTFIKLKRPQDAIQVFSQAAESESGPGRAKMGLCLAHFLAGDEAAAARALDAALEENPYFARAVLGQLRKQVDNPLAASPGSREEAALYAQTYGDVWDDSAKASLAAALERRSEGEGEGASAPAAASEAAPAKTPEEGPATTQPGTT